MRELASGRKAGKEFRKSLKCLVAKYLYRRDADFAIKENTGRSNLLRGIRVVSGSGAVTPGSDSLLFPRERSMFSGDESITFVSTAPRSQVYDQVEDALSTLGRAEVDDRGNIDIYPRASLGNALTQVRMSGSVRERGGKYTVFIEYSCGLSGGGLVILILGILFFLIGVLVLLAPMFAKDSVGRAVRRALRDLE